MQIDSNDSKSTFQIPSEVRVYLSELITKHMQEIPKNTPYIERFNMNISLSLTECTIETRASSFDRQKPYWEQVQLFKDSKVEA